MSARCRMARGGRVPDMVRLQKELGSAPPPAGWFDEHPGVGPGRGGEPEEGPAGPSAYQAPGPRRRRAGESAEAMSHPPTPCLPARSGGPWRQLLAQAWTEAALRRPASVGARRSGKKGQMTFQARFIREIAALGLPAGPGSSDPVTDSDLSALPGPVRRYMRFMGVLGRPRDWSFRLGFQGRFRRRVNEAWMRCEAWQYNSAIAVARIMHLRIRLGGVVPLIGRDTYLNGHGRMLIKVVDRLVVGDGTGAEYDSGELVTYLNDAVLMAPSMLLVPAVSWLAADPNSFDVTLTDHGNTVTARVTVDEQGRPQDFSTTDRFMADPEDPRRLRRARWTTPVAEWAVGDGRPMPAAAAAVWHPPEGDFPYAEFRLEPGSVAFNVPPGQAWTPTGE